MEFFIEIEKISFLWGRCFFLQQLCMLEFHAQQFSLPKNSSKQFFRTEPQRTTCVQRFAGTLKPAKTVSKKEGTLQQKQGMEPNFNKYLTSPMEAHVNKQQQQGNPNQL